MGWQDPNDERPRRISDAMHAGEVDEMRRLLVENPEFLRYEGTDTWLNAAAQAGSLPIVKMLVEMGIDVNEGDYSIDCINPLRLASMFGNLEVVHWLLDHGAAINLIWQGKTTCPALKGAARNGHFDIVKLLVERGANIHASWHGINALMDAEENGHKEIADYLRSLGVKDVRETTPPDYPTAHELFMENMAARQGPPSDWMIELPGEPAITIHHIAANPEHGTFRGQTLFTIGLSDHRLPTNSDAFHCTELRMLLPADWPLTESSRVDPRWNWPIEWLKRIAMELRTADRLGDYPPFFMNGNPPQPLAPGTRLCGWAGLVANGSSIQVPDWRWISQLDLYAIYAEEVELIRTKGHDELANRLHYHQIPLAIDPHRPNMAEPQYALPIDE